MRNADEIGGNGIAALMQALMETVLNDSAALAENDGNRSVIDGLSVARDGLAVALHLELLQIARQVAQSFAVRQDSLRRRSRENCDSRYPTSARMTGILEAKGAF